MGPDSSGHRLGPGRQHPAITLFRPDSTGPHLLGAAGIGHLTLTVDGTVVADGATAVPDDPVEAMARPGEIRATAGLEAGRRPRSGSSFGRPPTARARWPLRLGIVPAADEDAMLAEAEQAAAAPMRRWSWSGRHR